MSKMKKIIIVVAVCTLLLSFGAIIYGAYTHSLNAQRTIAPYESVDGDRFSSNYLLRVANSKENIKTIFVTDGSQAPTAVVTICNYIQGKQNKPNENDVEYTLSAKFVYIDDNGVVQDADSASTYSVTITKEVEPPDPPIIVTLNNSHLATNQSDIFRGTLTRNAAYSDTYIIAFSTDFAPVQPKPNLYLELTATWQDITLKGLFNADVRVQGASNAWSGSFNDDRSTPPSAYDGFNYLVSGIGSGRVTITWNSSLVTISYESLVTLRDIAGTTTTSNSVSFNVDSDIVGRYEIQFYKVDTISQTWDAMNSSVVYTTFNANAN